MSWFVLLIPSKKEEKSESRVAAGRGLIFLQLWRNCKVSGCASLMIGNSSEVV